MNESARLALQSVRRRWRRNLVSLIVIAAGVAAIIVLYCLSISSAEAVTSRLDSATRSQVSALLPGAAWERDETEITTSLLADQRITAAGTLVSPDRTTGSVVITNPRSSLTAESSIGIATPSGLRVAGATARSGGIGSDAIVTDLPNAIYLGSRLAKELDYPDVAAGPILINGQEFAVLGVISSDDNAWISASIIFSPASADASGFLPDQRVISMNTQGEITAETQTWIALTLSPTDPTAATVLTSPSAAELRAEILARGNSLTALVGIIAGISGFLTLAATTFASLTQRRREMGLYLALGYGRSFVSGQIVVEGAIVGVLGGITGLLLGALIAAGLSVMSYPLFFFPPLLLLLPIAAGMLGLVSALIPALAATRVTPSELLRD